MTKFIALKDIRLSTTELAQPTHPIVIMALPIIAQIGTLADGFCPVPFALRN